MLDREARAHLYTAHTITYLKHHFSNIEGSETLAQSPLPRTLDRPHRFESSPHSYNLDAILIGLSLFWVQKYRELIKNLD